jgi:hypothetical protein
MGSLHMACASREPLRAPPSASARGHSQAAAKRAGQRMSWQWLQAHSLACSARTRGTGLPGVMPIRGRSDEGGLSLMQEVAAKEVAGGGVGAIGGGGQAASWIAPARVEACSKGCVAYLKNEEPAVVEIEICGVAV